MSKEAQTLNTKANDTLKEENKLKFQQLRKAKQTQNNGETNHLNVPLQSVLSRNSYNKNNNNTHNEPHNDMGHNVFVQNQKYFKKTDINSNPNGKQKKKFSASFFF